MSIIDHWIREIVHNICLYWFWCFSMRKKRLEYLQLSIGYENFWLQQITYQWDVSGLKCCGDLPKKKCSINWFWCLSTWLGNVGKMTNGKNVMTPIHIISSFTFVKKLKYQWGFLAMGIQCEFYELILLWNFLITTITYRGKLSGFEYSIIFSISL